MAEKAVLVLTLFLVALAMVFANQAFVGTVLNGSLVLKPMEGQEVLVDGVVFQTLVKQVAEQAIAIANLRAIISASPSSLPPGMVQAFAGNITPAGWLPCDGRAFNATANVTLLPLFNAIGNTYGGLNMTNFRVPDLEGRVIAGKIYNATNSSLARLSVNGSGVDASKLGAAGGDEFMQKHVHGTYVVKFTAPFVASGDASYRHMWGATASAGNGNSQNVQPTLVLHFLIKI